ncbi:chloride channel, partial [Gorgonomyces haynaldii]
ASLDWILVSVCGAVIGLLAGWMDSLSNWMSDLKLGYCNDIWKSQNLCCKDKEVCQEYTEYYGLSGFLVYLVLGLLYSTVAGLLVHLYPLSSGSSIPETKTILGGYQLPNLLALDSLGSKVIGLVLVCASGLVVGKEGPMIFVGVCLSHHLIQLYPKPFNPVIERYLMTCGAAAGFGSAFGSPLGGVLFTLEDLASFFPTHVMIQSFFCSLVAKGVLQLLDPYNGKRVLFQVVQSRPWHLFEIILFLIVGLITGIMGAWFVKLMLLIQAPKDRKLLQVVVLTLVTLLFGYALEMTRIDGQELLLRLFSECDPDNPVCHEQFGTAVLSLLYAIAFKYVFAIVSSVLHVPQGPLIPTMIWGALVGRLFGLLFQSFVNSHRHWDLFASCPADSDCINLGMYSLLGAFGALAGTTKLAVSLTVVMFELTGNLSLVLPLMMTLSVARVASDYIAEHGLFLAQLRHMNLPYLDTREDPLLGTTVSHHMIPMDQLVVLEQHETQESIQRINQCEQDVFPVVESTRDPILLGIIKRSEINLQETLDLEKSMEYALSLDPNTSMEVCMDIFKKLGPTCIIVSQSDILLGMVTRTSVLNLLD